MTKQQTLDMELEDVETLEQVEPISKVKTGGAEYVYKYRCVSVAVDEIGGEIDVEGVELRYDEERNGWWWQYGDKVPVLLLRSGAYKRYHDKKLNAKEQAYFALSHLDELGLADIRRIQP